jgi:SpoVK/Ycf46/Vps4 family AAA+-type ATPase
VAVERVITGDGGGGRLGPKETLKLTAFGRDARVLKEIAADAMNHALADDLGKTLVFQPAYGRRRRSGNCWRKLMAVERRALASVHLPRGTLEALLADVRDFFAMREWYRRRGVPHRRGVLLHGPPGNGKSSVAAALAGELGLNLCVIDLAAASLDDDALQEYLRRMPKGSILLLEDVDAAFIQRDKADGVGNKVTFSGLLNALAGAVAMEGALVLMTTNHRERLDPALTRPGRIDVVVRVGLATRDQVQRLFAHFYQPWEAAADGADADAAAAVIERERKRANEMAVEFARLVPDELVSMASLQGYLLRFKLDPRGAIDNVAAFLAEERRERTGQAEEPARPETKKDEEMKKEEDEGLETMKSSEAASASPVTKESVEEKRTQAGAVAAAYA